MCFNESSVYVYNVPNNLTDDILAACGSFQYEDVVLLPYEFPL